MFVFFRAWVARRRSRSFSVVDGGSQVYLRVYLRARICALSGLNAARI